MAEERPMEETAEAVPRVAGPAPAPGDRVARVFERHHEHVLRTAYRVTGNAHDAEDVLQTVFLRLLAQAELRLDPEQAGSYLHRAAVNAALDLLRRRQASRSAPLEEEGVLRDPGPGPDLNQEEREIRERLRAALARLNPRHAEVFALRYFEGHDNRAIARMLGTSWSTIAVILHRTRARLRREVMGDEP